MEMIDNDCKWLQNISLVRWKSTKETMINQVWN